MTERVGKAPRRRPDIELLTAERILRQLWALSPDAGERVLGYVVQRYRDHPPANRPQDGGELAWSRRDGAGREPPWIQFAGDRRSE